MIEPYAAPKSYLIIGAGTFGAATALSLKQSEPDSDITVLDRTPFPCPMGAGHDLNKIVRADYDDLLYMRLGLKAMDSWKSGQLYSPHFYNTGFLWSENVEVLQPVIDAWESMTDSDRVRAYLMDPVDAKRQFNGIFRDSEWSKISKCMLSPEAGWVDSAAALRSVMQEAIHLGVKYIDSGASRILFGDDGACTGAETEQGQTIAADRTVLAAGAHIPFILAESAPQQPEIHAGERLVAVGAPMSAYRVPDDQMERFNECPVHGLAATLPGLTPILCPPRAPSLQELPLTSCSIQLS